MEEKDNIIADKSKKFAIRIINLYKYLLKEKKEYVLSKQLVRSGTSIGANVAEAICAISKKRLHCQDVYCLQRMFRKSLLD